MIIISKKYYNFELLFLVQTICSSIYGDKYSHLIIIIINRPI